VGGFFHGKMLGEKPVPCFGGKPKRGAKFDKPLAVVAFLISTCFKPFLMLFYWPGQIFFQITSLIA